VKSKIDLLLREVEEKIKEVEGARAASSNSAIRQWFRISTSVAGIILSLSTPAPGILQAASLAVYGAGVAASIAVVTIEVVNRSKCQEILRLMQLRDRLDSLVAKAELVQCDIAALSGDAVASLCESRLGLVWCWMLQV